MASLDGKVAIVTGAGTGIGRECAKLLAAEGAQGVLGGRRRAALDAVAGEIEGAGGTAHARTLDIQKRAEVEGLVAWTREQAGPVDILVNNAGAASRVLNVRFITDADWENTVSVNLTAVYLLTQAVLPDMLERKAGTIVTVSSLAALRPNMLGGAAYGAAKAGVRNFMTYLHNTFRNDGIRASSVLPGEVSTPIMDGRARPPSQAERDAMVQPEDIAAGVLLCCTLPARAVVEELIIAPTKFRDPSGDIEISRWIGAPEHLKPKSA